MRRMFAGWSACLALLSGSASASARSAPAPHDTQVERAAFHRALDEVLDQYVEPLDEADLLPRVLESLVQRLDRHSHFVSAEARQELLAERAVGGSTGLWVLVTSARDGRGHALEVAAVDPESPAALAGLRAGDGILAIDGHEVASLSQFEAQALLGGPTGRSVSLTVSSGGRVLEGLELPFQPSRVSMVTGQVVSTPRGRVGILRIRAFRSGVGDEVRRTLAALRGAAAGELAGVVLDLRGNPGGEVDEALIVADTFVARGLLTRTRGRRGRILREEWAHDVGTDVTTPMVVVQNRHSASSAELLAAALQDHGRARIVGSRSYGKGTVQRVTPMPDGSVLMLTVARYYSPKDRGIDGHGVTPDVLADVDRDDAEVYATAIEALGAR